MISILLYPAALPDAKDWAIAIISSFVVGLKKMDSGKDPDRKSLCVDGRGRKNFCCKCKLAAISVRLEWYRESTVLNDGGTILTSVNSKILRFILQLILQRKLSVYTWIHRLSFAYHNSTMVTNRR